MIVLCINYKPDAQPKMRTEYPVSKAPVAEPTPPVAPAAEPPAPTPVDPSQPQPSFLVQKNCQLVREMLSKDSQNFPRRRFDFLMNAKDDIVVSFLVKSGSFEVFGDSTDVQVARSADIK